MMARFVALRVFVQPGETNRAALSRTLSVGCIPFPLRLITRQLPPLLCETPDQLPDTDSRIGENDYFIKYEKEGE